MGSVIEAEGLEKRFGWTRALAGTGFAAERVAPLPARYLIARPVLDCPPMLARGEPGWLASERLAVSRDRCWSCQYGGSRSRGAATGLRPPRSAGITQ